jgi:hypothetical protein
VGRESPRLIPRTKEVDVSWNLKGSYFETCSCDLMCPCNLSFDHGATYDYCRATLVFHVREGEIEWRLGLVREHEWRLGHGIV